MKYVDMTAAQIAGEIAERVWRAGLHPKSDSIEIPLELAKELSVPFVVKGLRIFRSHTIKEREGEAACHTTE